MTHYQPTPRQVRKVTTYPKLYLCDYCDAKVASRPYKLVDVDVMWHFCHTECRAQFVGDNWDKLSPGCRNELTREAGRRADET